MSSNYQSQFFPTVSAKELVLVSACFLGIPCRWHGRRAKRRDELLEKLKEKYVIVPICPEQLGGMSTPRTSETLPPNTTGVDVLDNGVRLIAPETGDDVTDFHIRGGEYSLEIAQVGYLLCSSLAASKNSQALVKQGQNAFSAADMTIY